MPGLARIVAVGWILTLWALCSLATLQADELTDAVALYRTGQYDACAAACGVALEAGQFSESWPVLKIRAELARGRYPQARETLDQALQRQVQSVRLRWLGVTVCRMVGDEVRATKLLEEIDTLVSNSAWRYTDPVNRIVLGHYYLQRGIDAKQVLDATFSYVKKQQPQIADAYLAAAQLALAKHDYALAVDELKQAVQRDASDPDILFALAEAYEPSDSETSEEYLRKALEQNPRHIDSLLFVVDAQLDSEDYAAARATLVKIWEVNPLEPRAWALRAAIDHVQSDERNELVARNMGLAWWPSNPEVDHRLGRELSQKYRFREAARAQRRALAFDSKYQSARIQLAQDLLRLGEEEEGWQLADQVLQADGYQVIAHNLATLRDHLQGFRTITADGLLVRMEANEADIYGGQVVELLQRARTTLSEKYQVKLERTILVEIFPEQQDFAIRTFGLPGGDGFLGVCFGDVITANSPASQGATPSNWQSVLWHEFCHVITLNKTNNRMPRWLSEGISVYEERQADRRWGQWLTPQYREMLLGAELTPVSELSGAFLDPPSGLHLQFAYYESSLVVEFLVERYGFETLLRVLDDLGAGLTINESLGRYSGSIEALDFEFGEWARKYAETLGPDVDWSPAELEPTADLMQIAAWVKDHPQNYEGLKRLADRLLADEQWEAAKDPLNRLIALLPDDRSADNAYVRLAEVHRRLGDANAEEQTLLKVTETAGDQLQAYVRLGERALSEERWADAWQFGQLANAVNPLLPQVQRQLAQAAEQTGKDPQAIAALEALLTLKPIDVVDVHFRLACLLQRSGEPDRAKRHVLQALEEAPRFRAAHQKLKELTTAPVPSDARAAQSVSAPAEATSAEKPAATEPTKPASPASPAPVSEKSEERAK